jgi:hypothetical protein
MAGKEVAAAKSTAVATPMAFEEDAAIGRENMSVTDMSIPYFTLLQSLSPQVKKSSPAGIKVEGAEEGDIYNTVTKELFAGEDGINIIPCAFNKAWVEWQPRDSGGGFVTSYPDDSMLRQCERNEVGFDVRVDNGNLIVPTYYYYVMRLKEDGGYEFGIISMSRTAMKKGRKLNSLISALQLTNSAGKPFNPPMFSQIYKVTAIPESNAKGDFYNWETKFVKVVDDMDLYQTAKNFAVQVMAGTVKAAPEPSDTETHDDSEPAF